MKKFFLSDKWTPASGLHINKKTSLRWSNFTLLLINLSLLSVFLLLNNLTTVACPAFVA